MVELMGFEPTTSSMPRKRSPPELQPHARTLLYRALIGNASQTPGQRWERRTSMCWRLRDSDNGREGDTVPQVWRSESDVAWPGVVDDLVREAHSWHLH